VTCPHIGNMPKRTDLMVENIIPCIRYHPLHLNLSIEADSSSTDGIFICDRVRASLSAEPSSRALFQNVQRAPFRDTYRIRSVDRDVAWSKHINSTEHVAEQITRHADRQQIAASATMGVGSRMLTVCAATSCNGLSLRLDRQRGKRSRARPQLSRNGMRAPLVAGPALRLLLVLIFREEPNLVASGRAGRRQANRACRLPRGTSPTRHSGRKDYSHSAGAGVVRIGTRP
jgi:hypothetical protein